MREEPQNAARTVELMKLKYIVLTSVNRDDLPMAARALRGLRPRDQGSAIRRRRSRR